MTLALFVLRAAVVVAVFVAVFCLTHPLVDAPSGEAVRLGLRGLQRKRALEQSELWGHVEPAVRWLGRRLTGWIPTSTLRSVDRKIALGGDFLGLMPEELVALNVMTTLAGAAMGVVLGRLTGLGPLMAMAGLGYGVIGPYVALSSATSERFKAVSRRLPYAIDLLALAMGAGLDFPASVRQVVEKAGNATEPLIEELTLILQALHLGRSRRQALEEFAQRVPCDAVIDFVGAVVQAELRGTPLSNVLQVQAEVSRQRRTTRAEEAASSAGVKMVMPLMMVFVCVMILVVAPIAMQLKKSGI